MKYFNLASMQASRVAQGCMRIGGMTANQIDTLIKTDLECGINFFDHADIYGGGVCEEKFGAFLAENPSYRDQMLIQTKCGIKPGSYDFSKDHIRSCVEKSLCRLKKSRKSRLWKNRRCRISPFMIWKERKCG